MKRLFVWMGLTVGFVAIMLAAIPFFVDVDQYRPLLVSRLNERLSGTVEVGRLSLSLWGRVRVRVEGLRITDARGRSVLSVQDAWFHFPWSGLLSGEPAVNFHMNAPELTVLRDPLGQFNLVALFKPENAPKAAVSAPAQSEASAAKWVLPALALKSRLGLVVEDAQIKYRDEVSGRETRIQNLKAVIRDLSLARPTELEIEAQVDSRLGPSASVRGPIRLAGQASFLAAEIAGSLSLDFSQLRIEAPGALVKQSGVVASLDAEFRNSGSQLQFSRLELRMLNASVKGHGSLKKGPSGNELLAEFDAGEISVAPWTALIPALKSWEPEGVLGARVTIHGPSDHVSVEAKLEARGLSFRSSRLRTRPVVDAVCSTTHLRLEACQLDLKSPGTELHFRASVESFANPDVQLVITSPGVDLDQLLLPSASGADAKSEALMAVASPSSAPQSSDSGLAVTKVKSEMSPWMSRIKGRVVADVRKLRSQGVSFEDLSVRSRISDGRLEVENLAFKVFGGELRSKGRLAWAEARPEYGFNLSVHRLDLGQAVASQWGVFKDTLLGRLDMTAEGSGAGVDWDGRAGGIKVRGKMKVTDASFASLDVARMAVDAVNGSLEKASKVLPALKSRKLKPPAAREARYDSVSSTFSIRDGKFEAPDFTARSAGGKGIDLKGATSIRLVDRSIRADWEIVDAGNFSGAADLSLEVAGAKIPHVLVDGNEAFKLPVTVGCTLSKPCFEHEKLAEQLSRVAARNIARSVGDQVGGKMKDALRGKMDEIGKKLFGR